MPETLDREARVLATFEQARKELGDATAGRALARLYAAAEQRAEEAERLLREYLERCPYSEKAVLHRWPEGLEARTIAFLLAPHKAAEEETDG